MSFKIKTPMDWINNNDVKIGDELASIDGQPNVVTGVLPQGVQRVYRVTFSDRRFVEVSGTQLWKVHFVHEYALGCGSEIHNGWHVFTTDAIRTFCLNGSHRNGHRKVYVPTITGDFGSSVPLPIDPWLLGVLLGDGGLTTGTPTVTTADQAIIDRVATLIQPFALRVVPIIGKLKHRYGYRLSGNSIGRRHINGLMKQLQDLGLRGLDSSGKFIPVDYLNAGKEARWDLLRGLFDTDGTRGWSDEISFVSTSYQLALGVQDLVRSLGGLSAIYGPKRKWCTYKGEKREGKPAYYVSVRLPERENAFYLDRKKASERQHLPRLTIETIDYIGEQESLRITVSHPSGLLITDEYVVTHC